ncbi:hypothetical protein GCM10020254_23440 [Streptomyces goshikiensis]
MTALLRYQGALLLRSQRWLAPVLLYAAFLAVGFRPGDPVPDSLGYSAAALVPVTAWLVRICLSVEPDAARDCAAAAAGPVRVHAAALLTGLGWGAGAGSLGAVAVLLLGAREGPRLPAAALAGGRVGAGVRADGRGRGRAVRPAAAEGPRVRGRGGGPRQPAGPGHGGLAGPGGGQRAGGARWRSRWERWRARRRWPARRARPPAWPPRGGGEYARGMDQSEPTESYCPAPAAPARVVAGPPYADCLECGKPTEYGVRTPGVVLCPVCEWQEAQRTACSG